MRNDDLVSKLVLMFTQISLSSVPIGARFSSPIFDDHNTKLIAAGIEVTEQLIESLRRRSVERVLVNLADLGRMEAFKPQGRAKKGAASRQGYESRVENEHSRLLDRVVAEMPLGELEKSDTPFAAHIQRPGPVRLNADLIAALADKNENNVAEFATMSKACFDGGDANLELIQQITDGILHNIAEDFDTVAGLGANPYMHSYPSRHSQHLAMIAEAMGTSLGLDRKSIRELGVGCLIHDIGMLAVDRRIYESKQVLGDEAFAEITKHPIKTFDIIEKNLPSVPVAARMVAYQIHERCNGNGYPRRRMSFQMHPLARLAAVADTYVGLVTPRPHRAGMLPYFAMEKMIRDVPEDLFDSKAVRALLESVGLFPIGSYVGLNDNYVGRVIRSNGHQFARPVVEVWKADNLTAAPAIVDLANDTALKIEKPLVSLKT